MAVNWTEIREDFPILQRQINGKPLVYLDNGATSQKPVQVLKALSNYYGRHNANVYRSVHTLSGEATELYEEARGKVATFINANQSEEIIFTSGTTESINSLARSLASEINAGDEIMLTYMEHHSNIIPWQQLAQDRNAKLVYVHLTADGKIDLIDFQSKLNNKTKILAFTHVSNILGTINPVKKMTSAAHENGTLVVVDGAQAIPHLEVDVKDLDVDFYAFSGHKMLGPTGIGALYGKMDLLKKLEPANFGGEMIQLVQEETSTWAEVPHKFEAGTPNIAGAIGFGAAIDYLEIIGMNDIEMHEKYLLAYLYDEAQKIEGLEIFGPANTKDCVGVLSFNLDNIHPHDLATALDTEGVAIRAGHHCGQLLMQQLNVLATSRISLSFYNTKEDIDQAIHALKKAKEFFSQ